MYRYIQVCLNLVFSTQLTSGSFLVWPRRGTVRLRRQHRIRNLSTTPSKGARGGVAHAETVQGQSR